MAVAADMVERPSGKARHISYTLPAWTYNNAEFFELERERIFMRTWQLVRHVREVAEPGDYATLDLSGERAFVIRGQDGRLFGRRSLHEGGLRQAVPRLHSRRPAGRGLY